jgi:hypothetical protein
MKYATVLFTAILFTTVSFSQKTLEVFGRTNNKTIVPDVNFYGEKKISEKVSLTLFMLVEQKWSEGLVGISYSPSKWISIGASAGIEHNDALYRFGGMVWMGKGKFSLLLLGEKGNGTNNYWYKNTFSFQCSEKFSLGARAWRYIGVGPVATYEIKKLDSKIWIMPAYDFEAKQSRLALGMRIGL